VGRAFKITICDLEQGQRRQDKSDEFMYEEFGKVYEIINKFFEQKKIEEAKPRRRIGYYVPGQDD